MSIPSDSANLYNVKITFHSAHSLSVSDLPYLSTDRYNLVALHVPSYLNVDKKALQPLLFRMRTIHKTRDPDWGSEVWRVGGVPGAGFVLRVSVRDKDAGKRDDRLGQAHILFLERELTKQNRKRDAEVDWGLVREGKPQKWVKITQNIKTRTFWPNFRAIKCHQSAGTTY
jgi:hypothetical protein